MATRRKTKTRKDELQSSPAFSVRRSPRLSRLSHQPGEVGSHQLHFTASSRHSLNSYERSSQSTTPSTILDESGQSVPPSFDNFVEDPLPSGQLESAHLRVREVQERTGMPKHLYGLDYEEETVDKARPTVPIPGVPKSRLDSLTEESPTRIWHKFDKERLYVTAERSPPSYTGPQGQSSLGQLRSFCASILFKLGSFMYLASTAIMCLDVIILHRLFNLSSSVSQIGGALRFFVLLLALVTLGGVMLGGNIFPVEEPSVPLGEVEKLRKQFQSDMDILSTRLETLVKSNANQSDSISWSEIEKLRRQLQADLEDFSTRMDSLKKGNSEKIQSEVVRLETIMEKNANKDAVPRSEMEKLRNQFQADVDGFSASLDSLKQENSKETQEIQEIRSQLARLETLTRASASKDNGIPQSEVDKLRGQLQADIGQLTARLEALQDKKKEEAREALRRTEQMITDLKTELLKNMADDKLDLRKWIIHSTASSDNLKELERRVDSIINYTVDGVDISRQDIGQMINQSLEAYSADRIGSFDFVLENAGGSVMLDRCSSTYSHSVAQLSLFGFSFYHYPSSPKVIIQPSLYPGDCWAMEGQSGFATLKMSAEAIVTAVTVDHIPRELTPNGSLNSAPKAFTVFGLTDLFGEEVALGSYKYDLDGPNIQKYYIDESLRDRSSRYVRFEFSSNHGNKDYTCVYRVRVHGHYP